jgi:hypothetical protein
MEFERDIEMKKLTCIAAALLLLSTVGCANGPIRNFFRGAACNTCQPPFHPSSGTGAIGTCTDGCATPSTIPNPIIQSNPGQATISGAIVETPQAGQLYYPSGTPTTQGYGIQPAQNQIIGSGTQGNIMNPPTGGPIPQPNGF